jgi:Uncharacterised nucleotidyltransferase
MPERLAKRAVLSALRWQPDFSPLAVLSTLNGKRICALLEWLDHSGLALVFGHRLRAVNATSLLPAPLSAALDQRHAKNTARLRDMLTEFQRLADAFCRRGVSAVTLKGFSLFPDFCEDLALRHQTDFDFLVDPGNVEDAADALNACGYSTPRLSRSSESCFTTPLLHCPSRRDDLYSLQHHRQVDLHTSIWETSPWLNVIVPSDCLLYSEPAVVHSIHFRSLSLADKFLAQVLHAFRHSFSSWIRLSWLMEIGRCLELYRDKESLWRRVIQRSGDDRLAKSIFAFVLGLTYRLFACRTPPTLRAWFSEATTRSMQVWIDHFSLDWAISDRPGSLNNLFVARVFIPDRKRRLQYLKGRLIPRRGQTSIGEIAAENSSWKWNSARLRYVTDRSSAHLKNFLCLPWQHLRWWKTLALTRNNGIDLET